MTPALWSSGRSFVSVGTDQWKQQRETNTRYKCMQDHSLHQMSTYLPCDGKQEKVNNWVSSPAASHVHVFDM